MGESRDKADLLRAHFTRAAERITDEQLQQLLSGDARLSVTVRLKQSPRNSQKPRMSMAGYRKDFDDVRRRLASAQTRDECADLTERTFPKRADLLAFAKFLHIPMQRGTSRNRLREKIVEMTAGARIDADIIRRRR